MLSSCIKNETSFPGLIRFTGNVALDGCGWVIDVENETFHPNNLSTEFQIDSLKVKLSYKLTSENFNCGFGNSFKTIQISSIAQQ